MKSSWAHRITIKDLLLAFRLDNNPKSYSWIKRQESKGNLILPKSSTDYRKPRGMYKIGFVTQLNNQQIEEIIKAFRPNGKGYWSYQ